MKSEDYYLGYIDALDRTRQLLDFLNRHGTFRYSSASAYLRREMVRINGEYRATRAAREGLSSTPYCFKFDENGHAVPVEVPESCDTPKRHPLGILDQEDPR